MTFINTAGLSILGPGSEWLWTMLSGIVLAVTFLALYQQLRLQTSMAAREQLLGIDAQWSTELMYRFRLSTYEAWLDGTLSPDTVGFGDTCDFWDMLGGLVRSGHLDLRVVRPLIRVNVTWWWGVTGPTVVQWREWFADPTVSDNFEWLAMKVREGSVGMVETLSTPTRELVEGAAEGMRNRISLLQSVRS